MNSIASIALSGMNVAGTRLAASAHNLANLSTPGFQRQIVAQEALPQGGVTASVTPSARSGEAWADDVVEQKRSLYAFKANVLSLKAQDQMLSTLLDVQA